MSTNKDMGFHNWVKACLAIKCVRDVIIPLVEKYCKEHYSNNTDHVLKVCGLTIYSCNQCDVTEIEPYHKRSRTKCGYKKCACTVKNMNMKPCTENLACGVIYDQIKAAHTYNDPSWSNTNCNKWSSSAWEQMKCYISTPGYKEKADISCSDLTALIQICLNYIPLRTLFNQNIIDLDEVRRCRNDIYHSSTMELANDQLKHFLSTMKTFLMLSFFQDYKDEVDCQLDKLSKLENDEFEVSIENEIAARKDALDGMQELIADIQGNYSQMKDQLEEINKRTADQCSDNREIKQHLSAQTKNIELIHETQESMSESMSHLQTNIRESSEKTDAWHGKILASNGLILARMEQLYELLTKQNPDLKETLQTDIVTKINVKTTNAEAGDTVLEEMCTAGNEIINSFNGDSADDPLKHGLKDVVGKLQEGNNKVTGFKQKCLEIYVSSPTIKSWVTLNKAFFDGTIEKAFLPLQTYLRTRHGCSNLTLTIELDQECFNKCANTIISTLNRMFNNQQTEVHPNKVMGAQDILQVGEKLYDGTLRKRSQLDKLLGSTRWKQRFVVISQGCVYCFKSEYASRPLTAFSLTVYDSAVETEMHGVLNCFEIRHKTKDKTPHYFAAETDDKRKAWLGYLNDAIAQAHTFSGEKLSADSDEGIAGCKYKPVNRRSNVPLPPLPTASPSASSARAALAKASPKSEYDLESEEDDDPYDKVPEHEAPAKPSVTSPTRSGATLPGGVPLLPTTAGLQELSRKRPQTVSKRPPHALPGTYQETHIATDTIGRRTLSLAEPSATPNYINDTAFKPEDYNLESKDKIYAASLLKGKPQGTFLLRQANNTPHVLCVVVDGSVKEFQVFQETPGRITLNKDKYFPHLDNLLLFYNQNNLPKKEYAVKLSKGYNAR